jgi:hypothetical protein
MLCGPPEPAWALWRPKDFCPCWGSKPRMTVLARDSSNLPEQNQSVAVESCETVAYRLGREHGSRGMFISGAATLATTGKDYYRLSLSVCYSDL